MAQVERINLINSPRAAVAAERRTAKWNLHRGLGRLGIGLAVLWVVFWTCAYVSKPQSSEMASSLPPAFTFSTIVFLIAAALFCLPWIVSGFRSD